MERKFDEIVSVEPFGVEDVCDITVDHPEHLFYANGISVKNCSHAVSYGIDSYWCAWLLTHHEEEWLTAYLESNSHTPDDRARAIEEVKQIGYELVQVDINHATRSWALLPGKKFVPSFTSCKHVGSAAVDEILENRPYKTVYDLLWNEDGSWKHSKFNKRALETLIKIEAFGSMDLVGPGKAFSSYRHMYHVVIERADEIKKRTKKDPYAGRKRFDELVQETHGMADWTQYEKFSSLLELTGDFKVDLLVSPELQEKMEQRGAKSVDDVQEKDVYWFVLDELVLKKSKNGKEYALCSVFGKSGKKHKMYCWSYNPKRNEGLFLKGALYLGEVSRSDFGFASSAFKIKRVSE